MSTRDRQRVLITGGAGLIGSHLIQTAPRWAAAFEVLAPLRRELDLTNFRSLDAWFRKEKPDLVIHCAALSRASACQTNPALASKLNVQLTGHLAQLAAGVPFVFFSSDLVFDGQKGNYREEDAVHPLNAYAETKVAAEAVACKHPRQLIVRTSLNYGYSKSGPRAFNEEVLESWKQGKTLTFFTDEYRCPISAEITARALWELVAKGVTGLYHLAGAERLSRWQVCELLLTRHPQFRELARAGSLKNFAGPQRAPDTSLNCDKAQALLSFPLPKFSEWFQSESAAKP